VEFFSLFLPILEAFFSRAERKAAQAKARERRMAEHRMNARLLRMNI